MRMPARVFRWFELRVGACFGWRCGVWAAGGGLLGVWWRAGSPGRVILGQPGTDDKRTHRAQKSLSLTAESPLGLESNCAPRASPLRTPERMRSCRHSFDADDASEWSMRRLPSQMSPWRGSRQVGRIMSQTRSAACPKVGTSERWAVGSLPACASALISSAPLSRCGEPDRRPRPDSDVALAAAHDHADYPAPGAARLDQQAQPVAVRVLAARGMLDALGRQLPHALLLGTGKRGELFPLQVGTDCDRGELARAYLDEKPLLTSAFGNFWESLRWFLGVGGGT